MRLGVAVLVVGVMASRGYAWEQPALGPLAKGPPGLLLTFDDGPHRVHTKAILDYLDARGIQTVFFWVGHRIDGHTLSAERAEIAVDAQRRGHIIANHTVNHANLCVVDERKAEWEIDENQKRYQQLLGLRPVLFRAPYGADCRRLRAQLHTRGISHMHWDLDPQEWKHHSADATLRYLQREIRAIDGRMVILLHDTNVTTVSVVPQLIAWVDEENQRRVDNGQLPIEWLSPSLLLVEQNTAPVSIVLGRFASGEASNIATALADLL